jgi:hypothetical protein
MSTYGGDSWVPEAMHRKHQVDQLLADVHHLERYSNQWRRLSNGRFACLVCPHRPVLDTFPMLIVSLPSLFLSPLLLCYPCRTSLERTGRRDFFGRQQLFWSLNSMRCFIRINWSRI